MIARRREETEEEPDLLSLEELLQRIRGQEQEGDEAQTRWGMVLGQVLNDPTLASNIASGVSGSGFGTVADALGGGTASFGTVPGGIPQVSPGAFPGGIAGRPALQPAGLWGGQDLAPMVEDTPGQEYGGNVIRKGRRRGNPIQVFPTAETSEAVSSFGAPRTGHLHQGNDIMAPAGTPVYAMHGGVVEFESGVGDAGNAAWVRAPWGNTAYFHLQGFNPDVESGARVKPGDLIGYVGDTGNAAGNPHLHTELRVGDPETSDATDIYPFLRDTLRRGDNPGATKPYGATPPGAPAPTAPTGRVPVTQEDFARRLLREVEAPRTPGNVNALLSWQQAEEEPTPGFNPLNTTQGGGPATQQFGSFREGVQATADTLQNGLYQNILDALEPGDDPFGVVQAIQSSPWASSHYGGSLPSVLAGLSPQEGSQVLGTRRGAIPVATGGRRRRASVRGYGQRG